MPERKCDYAFGDQGGPLCIMLLYAVETNYVESLSSAVHVRFIRLPGLASGRPLGMYLFVGFRASFLKDF